MMTAPNDQWDAIPADHPGWLVNVQGSLRHPGTPSQDASRLRGASQASHASTQNAESLAELFTPAIAGELLPIVASHIESRTPFLATVMLEGTWTVIYAQPCSSCSDRRAAAHMQLWPGYADSCRRTGMPTGITYYPGIARDPGPLAALSLRELEILKLIAEGHRTETIGQILSRSPRTIQGHRIALGRKLGVTTRTELARVGIHAGLDTVPFARLNTFIKGERPSGAARRAPASPPNSQTNGQTGTKIKVSANGSANATPHSTHALHQS